MSCSGVSNAITSDSEPHVTSGAMEASSSVGMRDSTNVNATRGRPAMSRATRGLPERWS
ncbi:hypothetical protein [Bradyrhizobium uaiense]|uniref:hypothetical protein n=1 Tax=Bradyrhizobium uaiense TaxID=2594946 RepID=UPI0013D89431|nr:hypothetical protein [Bradyrhizobium uaiense]